MGRPQPLFRPPEVDDALAGLPALAARAVRRLKDLALECRSVAGEDLIAAVEKAGLLVGLESFVSEANSLYEYLLYQVLEATVLAAPAAFPEMARLMAEVPTLKDLVGFARKSGLEDRLEITRRRGSEEEALESFLEAVSRLRGAAGYRSVADADIYALGPDYVRESFREALSDPESGHEVRRAFRRSALGPMPLLTIHRLLYLLQSQDYSFKIRELFELPWESFELPSATAFVPGLPLERVLNGLGKDFSEPPPEALQFGRWLARGRVVVRHVSGGDMDAFNRERMGEALRIDNIPAARRLANGPGEPDEILLLDGAKGRVEEDDALHEFVHILQAEREGGDWVSLNLIPAEMEAHAVEIHGKRRRGDHRLYRQLAALSPYGFPMGLRLYVEQVYFRLMDAPGIVS